MSFSLRNLKSNNRLLKKVEVILGLFLFFGAAADQSAGQLAWVVRNMRLFGVGAKL